MLLKSDLFCGLSSAPAWLSWLRGFASDLHNELVTHLREKPGCRNNRRKMMDVLKKISTRPNGSAELETFLRKHFPQVIKNDPGGLPVREVEEDIPVFGHYDPSLLTLPRRVILAEKDEAKLLELVKTFLIDKSDSDYVIIGTRAYVEYMPLHLAKLVKQIPAKNWLTTQYKAKSSAVV